MDRLEKKIELLQRLLERKNVELETARSCKETSDQEVKKYELLFAIDEEALEIEVFATQDQISKIVAAFETLKNQQGVTRAGFTNHMISVNNRISKLVTKSVQRPNIVTFVGNIGIPFTGSMCSIFAIYLMVKWRNRDEEIMLTQQRIIYSKSVSFGERLLQEIQRPWWGWYWWGKVEKKVASNQVVFKTQPLEYFYH
ncbi:hypothetical protein MKW98_019373 [Papaver atlanticum]|uniref:Uncharacterized protein n=1 Tax=Papaver atlanticum TaxID=357466 RepID=A0AAD4S9X4_9MAGN|nr:hypothetical protein MKW98_019373 [Papaver atlanticum]